MGPRSRTCEPAGPTRRAGRFRLTGPTGRCVVRYLLTETTISVRAQTAPDRFVLLFQFRGTHPAVIRHATRFGERCEAAAEAHIGEWDLRPRGGGQESLERYFADLFEMIGAGVEAPASRTRTLARIRGQRYLRALGREAAARCERRARELALTFAEGVRFWVYQQIVADPSGRVAQMAEVCPGLVVVARAVRPIWGTGHEACESLLDGIRAGEGLPRLLDAAAESSLAQRVVEAWALIGEAQRFASATARERARAKAARRVLIRRAGRRVAEWDLLQMPPAAFAPEDIPREPNANARWYFTMRGAGHVIGDIPDVALREGLSGFVSANAHLVTARAERPPPTEPVEVAGGLWGLLQRLIRFSRHAGRMPSRRSNARRLLADCERWLRKDDGPAARLGMLLRRVPALELGEVTAVTALDGFGSWSRLERIYLPRSPLPTVAVAGMELRQIETPEALTEEGIRMDHCVGSWLSRVMGGNAWVYAARIASEPITVALERLDSGRVEIVEARRAHDELPTAVQRRLLEVWVKRVNGAHST